MAAGMMLDHVKRKDLGDRLRQAIDDVLNKDGRRTGDLGGSATTDEYAKALVARIRA
jgi:isocitrate dehydrogenase (NAD+)